MTEVTFEDVLVARERLDDEEVVHQTPIERSRSLSDLSNSTVRLKMEHLQRTGSFKTRGAYNKLRGVAEAGEADRAVAASAGNHAQGVALAAQKAGLEATIVMPKDAPQAKVDATRGYGAEVVLHGSTFQEAVSHARSITGEEAVFVHAYDDPEIVAGQGTLGLEINEQVPDIDTVIVPIGGGGLIGGIAVALSGVAPDVRVVGVQAADAATVPQSLDKGGPVDIDDPDTIADGIATGGISPLTFELIAEHVDEIVTVDDDQIAEAILVLLERTKQLVEGAAAASVAALLSDDLDVSDETVVPLLCGGNIDMTMLQTVLTRALTERSRLLRLRVHINDKPGKMGELSSVIGEYGANIRTVRHERSGDGLDVGEAYLIFQVVTSGQSHADEIIAAIRDRGYDVQCEG